MELTVRERRLCGGLARRSERRRGQLRGGNSRAAAGRALGQLVDAPWAVPVPVFFLVLAVLVLLALVLVLVLVLLVRRRLGEEVIENH